MKISGAWRERWAQVCGIDLRTLALFRVTLAAALIAGLWPRLPGWWAFYTDAGVLPRDALIQNDAAWRIDLYLASGDTWFAALLLSLTLLAALALAAGWRTRSASVLLFVLLGSLLNRNPLLLTAGDSLLTTLLFWSMFLPLSARWSVDAALSTRPPPAADRHASWAATGIQLQALAVLLLAVMGGADIFGAAAAALTLLLPGPFWNAAARRLDHGRQLRIFYDRDCAPCLQCCRLLQTFLILPRTTLEPAQELGRADRLRQVNHSWVVIDHEDVAHLKWNGWVALLRHSLLLRGLYPLARLSVWDGPGTATYDFLARLRKRGAALQLAERAEPFETGPLVQKVAAAALVALLAWGLARAGALPAATLGALQPVLELLRIDPPAELFSPSAPRAAGWAVFPGKLEDGSDVDVLRPGQALSWDRPRDLAHAPDRWQLYRLRLSETPNAALRPHYGRYLCRQWNREAASGRKLVKFNMTWVQEFPAAPGAPARTERAVGWWQECGAPPSPAR